MIDIRTLILVIVLSNFLHMFALALHSRLPGSQSREPLWMVGTGLVAAGFLAAYFRGSGILGMVAILGNNLLFVAAQVVFYAGIRRFFGYSFTRRPAIIAYLLFAAGIAFFTFAYDSILIRSLLLSVASGIISFFAAKDLLRMAPPSLATSSRLLAAVFVSNGLMAITRVVGLILVPPAGLFSADPVQVASYLAMLVIGFLWTMGYILLMNQKLEVELENARDTFQVIFDNSPEAGLLFRLEDGLILKVNQAFTQLTGYSPEEAIGKRSSADLHLWADPEARTDFVRKMRTSGRCDNLEVRFRRKDGSIFTCLLSSILMSNDGTEQGLTLLKDISESKQAELELHRSEERYRLLAEHSADVIWTLDMGGRIIYVSPAVQNLLGSPAEALIGKNFDGFVAPDELAPLHEYFLKLIQTAQSGSPESIYFETTLRRGDGSLIQVESTARSIIDTYGTMTSFTGMSRNIEERKRLEHELFVKATTDSLTGVLTRSRFLESAEKDFDANPVYEGRPVLSIFDVDNFKTINDRYGHVQGDRVLQTLSRICKAHLGNEDLLGRFGGDEFIVYFPDKPLEQGMEILEHIREDIGRESFAFTISAGLAARRFSDEDFETLLERADQALYSAKGSGRNGILSAP